MPGSADSTQTLLNHGHTAPSLPKSFSSEKDAAKKVLLKRMSTLAQLTKQPNWDDEGAVAIDAGEWSRAVDFLKRIEMLALPLPFVAPCGDGSIHFNWTESSGQRLNVELRGSTFCWSARQPDGTRDASRCDSLDALESRIVRHFAKK